MKIRISIKKLLFRLFFFGVTLACLVRLGFWQLDRAREKTELLARYSIRKELPVVELKDPRPSSEMEYRAVKIHGHLDLTHQFLWENQIYQHRLGYYVMAPFFLEDQTNPMVVLVNRGWIPARADGQRPEIPPETHVRWVKGFLHFPSTRSFRLGEDKIDNQHWPQVISTLDIPVIQKTLSVPVASFLLWQVPNGDSRWIRDWQPVVFGAEKHRGYAFQWFALAVAWCVMFIYFLYYENTRR